ncbi:MAG: prepilin-type N-terminal cleavage/methylation domain-containing protein [Bacteriovoracia bacterium]
MGARWKNQGGFTLIEVLVVIALIAIIATIALPTVSSQFKISLRSVTRNLASTVREAYNATVITGQVHRVVYDIKEGQYWVEIGPPTVLLDSDESRELEKRNQHLISAADEDKKPKSKFKLESTITRSKISLPRGVTFEDVVTEQSPEPIKEGSVYTHFFPHGLAEQTLIHLADNSDHKISLVVAPLIGKTRVMEGYVDPDEAFGKKKH